MRFNGSPRWARHVLGLLLTALLGLSVALPVFAVAPDPAVSPAAAADPTATVKEDCLDPPLWATLDGWKVLEIRAVPGVQDPEEYRQRTVRRLHGMARNGALRPEQLVLQDQPPYTFVGLDRNGRFTRELAVEDHAAACFGISRQELATQYRDSIRTAIARYRRRNTLNAWLEGSAQALLVLGTFILWLRGQLTVNRRLRERIARRQSFPLLRRLRVLHKLLDTDQARSLLQWLRTGAHWLLLLLVSYLLIPLLLGFFPPTEGLAAGLRSQIIELVAGGLSGGAAAIPNLLSILVILSITVLVIRASNAWFSAVDRGQMRIPGFYQEWALPTARLATILIALIGLVLAYPYIPGSNSRAFQGVGLLLGVLTALGSSAIATNIISGLMLIYTRAFRDGDRVDINGTVGVVQERALLVTRVRTPRNELVSIPNATVIGSSIVNFSFSRREIQQPVAIAPTITIGYDVPWRQVHELMLAAAASVPGVSDEIPPYVLQTSLNDFHISYELNAFVIEAGTYRETLSAVLAALQDQFAAAGIEILSPGYHAIRNGNASTLPKPAPTD
ncbi:mechanosensitive ion channel family protein [Synechococcus sp. CCY 9618]|uniref:mechanosensitive ion channel family protein n=1 Tax=Synechococcus sp. CCY 9618 TaxID=2815602 RepID=UPI001C227D08|nr:mechanosensitive ion channel domain-containing protein [Synechococcus sp. CCY 9618]